ncbi:MAG: aldehyde dehydrogenase family protein [Thermoanaerobaculia bacterium]
MTALEVGPPPAASAVPSEIDRIYELQRGVQPRVAATDAKQRIQKIRRLHDAVMSRRGEIQRAIYSDYRKPPEEVDLSEIFPVVSEARHAIRHLASWMKPQPVRTPLALFGSSSTVCYEPKGVVLVISPWNFPLGLTFGPLISAVAAGNCVIAKPSEMTPSSSACMKRILADVFDESEVAVIEGDASVSQQLLRKKFDHIFFTGSPRVGRIVMKAAAENLTPVTLELGGKSPVIVDRTADLDEAARKIAWGKSMNSGQVCLAPDYLVVDESIREPFTQKLRAAIAAIGSSPRSALVNDAHAARIKGFLDEALHHGGEVLAGGKTNGREIDVTVVANAPAHAAVMNQEIFGPLLPIVGYRDVGEALRIIAERETPLVLYLFSRDRRVIERVKRETSSGGMVVNDTLVHFNQLYLPFGGVGESGMGKGHGRYGFEAFSNARGVLEQPTKWSLIQTLYPPFTWFKRRMIDFTLRFL